MAMRIKCSENLVVMIMGHVGIQFVMQPIFLSNPSIVVRHLSSHQHDQQVCAHHFQGCFCDWPWRGE